MALEYWLRGPVDNIPALLQPAAHALLQARDEINETLKDFPKEKLWSKPAMVASVAFHLQHIPGVIDRLFSYADGNNPLSQPQMDYLATEGKQTNAVTLNDLLLHLNTQFDWALKKMQSISESTLTETRLVGRKQIPSTVIGLIFHAAEHTMRHTGQLLVTAAILKDQQS